MPVSRPREHPLWLKIPLNLCGPLGLGLALLGYLNKILGVVFTTIGVIYVAWEVHPSSKEWVRKKPRMSLAFFILVSALGGALVWLVLYRQGKSTPPSTEKSKESQSPVREAMRVNPNVPEHPASEQRPVAPKEEVNKVAKEVQRRRSLFGRLQQEYLVSHDGLTPAEIAGTEITPREAEWINVRLKEKGESWTVSATQSPSTTPQETPLPLQQPSPKTESVFDSTVAEWRLENQPESLELHDLFLTDFKSVQQKAYGAIFVDDAKTISVQYSINVELAARSKFLGFYIGREDQHTADVCAYLADHYQFVLDNAVQLLVEQKSPGDSGTISTKEAVFSGRIFVYHETYMPAEDTVRLAKIYSDRGASAIFRGIDYLSTKKNEATIRKLRRTR